MRPIHGDYGVTVNTGACGALNQGSIPCSRPKRKEPTKTPHIEGFVGSDMIYFWYEF